MHHIAILGGGPAGYVAASHAAAHGARVTLIEPKPLGGTCLNQGCVPTKVLVESCNLLEKAKAADKFGLHLRGEISGDWQAIMRRSAEIVETLGGGIEHLMADRNVSWLRAYGTFLDQKTILVNGQLVRPDKTMICTGSVPVASTCFAVDGETIGTSDDVLRWETLPNSVMIIGSGIIACEFAFIFNSLGVAVTIVASGSRVMSHADKDIIAVLQREMRKRGIDIKTNCRVQALTHRTCSVAALAQGKIVAIAERALVAVGRRANTDGLGLNEIGIEINGDGSIAADDVCRTNVPWIFAVGDVNGRSGLAHAASAQAKLAVDYALGRHHAPLNDFGIPVGVFTNPEIGYVGRTDEEARADGLEVVCGKFDLRALGRAHAMCELSGLVKVVVERDSGTLLGLHIIGPHAAELVHEGALLIRRGGQASEIFRTVHAHPTLSEGVLEAIEDALGQATHKPLAKRQSNVLELS